MQKSLRPIRLAVLLAVLGGVALMFDKPIAQSCHNGVSPAAVAKLLALAEVFGHGFGVFAILLTVAVLDPARRWALPRLALASFGAGLMANVFKLLIARTRPHHFDLSAGISESFLDWLPLWNAKSYQQGFPSSHTATAAGLAIGLAWLYPRGRWLFAIFAGLVAGQRIESGAHFLSDTLWGAAIGLITGGWAVRARTLGWLGDRLEIWLGRPSSESPPTSVINRTAA